MSQRLAKEHSSLNSAAVQRQIQAQCDKLLTLAGPGGDRQGRAAATRTRSARPRPARPGPRRRLPRHPRRARHLLAWRPPTGWGPRRRRRHGFVFQQFHLAPGVHAIDNVADGLLCAGIGLRERPERAARALERVGLGHRLTHRPNELSGGEQQRTAITRAVVGEPSLLLADEPTGALDCHSGESLMRLLADLHQGGTTIVVITHDRDVAAHLPRLVSMLDGQVAGDRTAVTS